MQPRSRSTSMMLSRLKTAASLLLAAVVLTACGDDDPTGPSKSVDLGFATPAPTTAQLTSSDTLNWDENFEIRFSDNGKHYLLQQDRAADGSTAAIRVYEDGVYQARLVPLYNADKSAAIAYEWHAPDLGSDWVRSDTTGLADEYSPSMELYGFGEECEPGEIGCEEECTANLVGDGDECGGTENFTALVELDGSATLESGGPDDPECIAARENFQQSLEEATFSGVITIWSGSTALALAFVTNGAASGLAWRAAGISGTAALAFVDSLGDTMKDYRTMKAACAS